MILLTWNVESGRGTETALRVADQLAADVLLLQETALVLNWQGAACCGQVQQRAWGSAVLVRHGSLQPLPVAAYSGWVTGARWRPGRADFPQAIDLFSIHSPTSSDQAPRAGYVAESLQIVRAICAMDTTDVPLVIGGDFNFKSFGERLPSERLATSRSELEALREFRDLGFCVAWRDAHPGLPLPQTLRWKGARATPYHCDGFLLRGIDVRTIQCEVLSSGFVTRQSDHNPLVSWARIDGAG